MIIYLVKVYSLRENYRDRTWGYYSELAMAQRVVLENYTDIFENNYYNYACIVAIHEGILSHAAGEEWYFADYSSVTRNNKEPAVTFVGKYDSYINTKNSPLSKFRKEIVTVGLGGESIKIKMQEVE